MWFAFQGLNGGKAVSLSGFNEAAAVADGFHGYSTKAEAEAQPNSLNPLTRIEAEAFVPGTFAADPAGSVAGAAEQTVTSAVPGLSQIGTFFGDLTQKATWVRLAEILLGGILLLVGLNKAFGNPAGKTARIAAKGAAVL